MGLSSWMVMWRERKRGEARGELVDVDDDTYRFFARLLFGGIALLVGLALFALLLSR